MWDIRSVARDRTCVPALEARTLNCWPPREIPSAPLFLSWKSSLPFSCAYLIIHTSSLSVSSFTQFSSYNSIPTNDLCLTDLLGGLTETVPVRCTAQSLACRKSGSYGWCYLRRADVGTELLRVPDRCWSPFFFVTQGGPYICQLPESLSGSCGQRLDEKPFLPGCTAYSTCKIGSMCVCVCVCVCVWETQYIPQYPTGYQQYRKQRWSNRGNLSKDTVTPGNHQM